MPRPAVLFPDAAAVTIGHLTTGFAAQASDALVFGAVPNPRPPGPFVTVRRGGGPRQTLISDNAQILLECWAATPEQAHDLAQLTRALVGAMAGTTQDGVPVYRVDEAAGPANLPDPLSDQARYVLTVQVHLRGAAL